VEDARTCLIYVHLFNIGPMFLNEQFIFLNEQFNNKLLKTWPFWIWFYRASTETHTFCNKDKCERKNRPKVFGGTERVRRSKRRC